MDELRVYVTSADIQAARQAWEAARASDAPAATVDMLRRDMEQLWRLQAHQFREEFRSTHGRTEV
ncbi:hypothetical protein [Cellulomonas carbonis]|uniref:Uncharacterized protein n=1 Tax=Cellulomonas carbonis T26 TaxID=947969 RepID=A0A0A0BUT0_9CELL|nr:hypothetical protein [Cellulomonas carbonis]KGM11457.1 hypothetical protein N868_08865 [Cellulomonas carbonis T26]